MTVTMLSNGMSNLIDKLKSNFIFSPPDQNVTSILIVISPTHISRLDRKKYIYLSDVLYKAFFGTFHEKELFTKDHYK